MTRRREHIIFLSPYIGCLSVSIDFKIILLALKELYGLVPELFFPLEPNWFRSTGTGLLVHPKSSTKALERQCLTFMPRDTELDCCRM